MDTMATIASFGGLFLAGANVMIFCIIKFNDLAHLQKSVEEIKQMIKDESNERKEVIKEVWNRVDSTTERIAKVEGRLNGM
jgi:hypothetical protein